MADGLLQRVAALESQVAELLKLVKGVPTLSLGSPWPREVQDSVKDKFFREIEQRKMQENYPASALPGGVELCRAGPAVCSGFPLNSGVEFR